MYSVWRSLEWLSQRTTKDGVMESYLTNRPTERAAYAVKARLPHFAGKLIQTVTAADIAAYKTSRDVSDSSVAEGTGYTQGGNPILRPGI